MSQDLADLFDEAEVACRRFIDVAVHHPPEELNHLCYANFARTYDQHMEETGHFRVLRQHLGFLREGYIGSPFLDVSCGTGEAISFLRPFLEEQKVEVTANEISPQMQEIARRKLSSYSGKIEFTEHDVIEFPSEDGIWDRKFSSVLCSYSLHGFPSPKENALYLMRNAVKRNGYLILVDEWPCTVTPSSHISPLVAELLRRSEKPMKKPGDDEDELVASLWSPIDDIHTLYTFVFKIRSYPLKDLFES